MDLKERVAQAAAEQVQSGMLLGLGSGSTVYLVAAALGERVKRGDLHAVRVVAASTRTEAAARAAGLPLTSLEQHAWLDLAIDGADEVDPDRNMIKGGGGALLRERIVLAAAERTVIAVDESKLVQRLGERWAVPVEVVQWGWRVAERILREYGAQPSLRMEDGASFRTDEGNVILDCQFGPIGDPAALSRSLDAIPGVMDHGLFLGYADQVLVGSADGVREL